MIEFFIGVHVDPRLLCAVETTYDKKLFEIACIGSYTSNLIVHGWVIPA